MGAPSVTEDVLAKGCPDIRDEYQEKKPRL